MANINALKNRIRSNVKSNDNQEITGPVMQDTLLDMTNELDPSIEEQRAMQAEAALNRGLEAVTVEVNKKPDVVDISQYHNTGDELPLSACYLYSGTPTYSRSGHCIDTGDDFIAICNYNWDVYPSIFLYVKNAQNKYIYHSSFHTIEAETQLELFVASLFEGAPVTYENNGLMKASDKVVLDEMVTEVFPLTVAVASSNAGTYEIGDAQHSVTPQIVLSITRKGADVSSSAQTTSSQGTVQSDHKTIIGSALTSGTTTYQISVSQGGQTKSAPSQVFDFMNYMYYGEVSTKPVNATAVATLCENGTLSKQLSRATTKSSTNLAANKYYVFAVKGSVNLVCRHAGTDAVVTGCTTGTAIIQRVNQSGSDSYSYIIVEKSASAWSFKITNS